MYTDMRMLKSILLMQQGVKYPYKLDFHVCIITTHDKNLPMWAAVGPFQISFLFQDTMQLTLSLTFHALKLQYQCSFIVCPPRILYIRPVRMIDATYTYTWLCWQANLFTQ